MSEVTTLNNSEKFNHLSAYEIRQGTLEQKEAEREWVLAHYANTAKKRSLLSNGSSANATESDGKATKKARR